MVEDETKQRVARRRWVDGPTIVIGTVAAPSLQAAGRAHARPDAYVAHLPATPRLLEEFCSYDLSVLAALDEPALTMPGLLSWATDDRRTGHQATAELSARLGCDVEQYGSLGHETTGEVVANLYGLDRSATGA